VYTFRSTQICMGHLKPLVELGKEIKVVMHAFIAFK
jgi:hypothetical protein